MTPILTTAVQLARLVRHRIGIAESATLFAIASIKNPKLIEIAEWLDMPKIATRGRIQALKGKGLVYHVYGPNGSVSYRLTERGSNIITDVTQ